MMKRIRKLLLCTGLTDDEYNSIKKEIKESNLQNLKIFSTIAFIFLFAMFILTFFIEGIVRNRWLYFTAALIDAGTVIVSKLFFKNSEKAVTAAMYVFIGIIFAFGILMGAVKNTDQLAVTYIALLLTGPMLFTDRPIRMILSVFISAAVFIFTAMKYKSGTPLIGDIFDTIVFGCISSIVSTYMMSVKCREILFKKKAVILSETDMLTGLRNRNSFEQNIKSYPSRICRKIVCVYADVNGLHEINNSQGHEAGDRMLRFVADSISGRFGMLHTYRIGGDEFAAFALDSGEDIAGIIDSITAEVKSRGYNVSLGYASADKADLDMDKLIKTAESEMFAAKKVFYAETGYCRRSGF